MSKITVPDIGDFKDVEVIDVLVKAGDKIDVDTPLLTIETEKATMDVPSTSAGVVKSVAIKKGDRVSKGSVIVEIDAAAHEAPRSRLHQRRHRLRPKTPKPRRACKARKLAKKRRRSPTTAPASAPRQAQVTVPDIGDFKDVEVIEVLVKPGDTINVDSPLITLETEKATMDVPATAAGKVKSVAVKKGDRVSKGSVIARARDELGAAVAVRSQPRRPVQHAATPSSPQPSAASAHHRRSQIAVERSTAHTATLRATQSARTSCNRRSRILARPRQPFGAQICARSWRRPCASQRHRRQRPHHARRRQSLGQASAHIRCAAAGGATGAGFAESSGNRLLEVRRDRSQAARPYSKDLRAAPASELAQRPARLADGRSGYHRARRSSQQAQRQSCEGRHQAHAARVHSSRMRESAAGISERQQLA